MAKELMMAYFADKDVISSKVSTISIFYEPAEQLSSSRTSRLGSKT